MKKQSIIESVVLTVVVIAHSFFLWNKITTSTIALNGGENVAAVATQITNAGSGTATADPTAGGMFSPTLGMICGDTGIINLPDNATCKKNRQEVLAAWNSLWSPNLTTEEANGSIRFGSIPRTEGPSRNSSSNFFGTRSYAFLVPGVMPPAKVLNASTTAPHSGKVYTTSAYRYPRSSMNAYSVPSKLCKNFVLPVYPQAETVASSTQFTYISTSTQFVMGDGSDLSYPYGFNLALGYDGDGNIMANTYSASGISYKGWTNGMTPPIYGYCLDAGYVSNYPNYVTKIKTLADKYILVVSSMSVPHYSNANTDLLDSFFPFGGKPKLVFSNLTGKSSFGNVSTPITAKPTLIRINAYGQPL